MNQMKQEAQFLLTIGSETQFATAIRGEFMMGQRYPRLIIAGRSNVGKSSLINVLLEKRLAQTSAEPGKTRSLHFYVWPKAKKVVADIPGYGFAKASQTERNRWNSLISAYLEADPHLTQVLVLLDARHGPTDSDLAAIEFLSFKGLPVTLVFTKADTLKTQSLRSTRKKETAEVIREFSKRCPIHSVFWVSARTGAGIKPLVQFLIAGDQEQAISEEDSCGR